MQATFTQALIAGIILLLSACNDATPTKKTALSPESHGKKVSHLASEAYVGKTIRFGTDASYPPFESINENGSIVGFDIDIANAMCEVLKAKCTFVNQEWGGIITELKNNKYDVIASSMSITPPRMIHLLFTKTVWSTPSLFIAKSNTSIPLDAQKSTDYAGFTIGVQKDTVQHQYISKHYPAANVKVYTDGDGAIKDLKTGNLQVVFSDGGTVTHLIDGPSAKYKTVGKPVASASDPVILGSGTGFAVRLTDNKRKEALDHALGVIIENGTYKKIANKYFKFKVHPKG